MENSFSCASLLVFHSDCFFVAFEMFFYSIIFGVSVTKLGNFYFDWSYENVKKECLLVQILHRQMILCTHPYTHIHIRTKDISSNVTDKCKARRNWPFDRCRLQKKNKRFQILYLNVILCFFVFVVVVVSNEWQFRIFQVYSIWAHLEI